MGINRWCSRAWDGRLCLVVALASTPGCSDQLGQEASIPSGTPAAEAALVPNAPAPKAPTPEELALEFQADAPSQPLCGDVLLGGDFSLDDAALPTLYVDAASDALAGDGSLAAP